MWVVRMTRGRLLLSFPWQTVSWYAGEIHLPFNRNSQGSVFQERYKCNNNTDDSGAHFPIFIVLIFLASLVRFIRCSYWCGLEIGQTGIKWGCSCQHCIMPADFPCLGKKILVFLLSGTSTSLAFTQSSTDAQFCFIAMGKEQEKRFSVFSLSIRVGVRENLV